MAIFTEFNTSLWILLSFKRDVTSSLRPSLTQTEINLCSHFYPSTCLGFSITLITSGHNLVGSHVCSLWSGCPPLDENRVPLCHPQCLEQCLAHSGCSMLNAC